MREKKAQSSVELLILIGFLMIFFVVFLGVIQDRIYDKSYEKKNILMKDIVTNVQQEINLAVQSMDGYYREFEVPEKIINDDYEIYLFDNIVYANSSDQKHAIAVDIPEVVGSVQKGINVIKKENGVVYLN